MLLLPTSKGELCLCGAPEPVANDDEYDDAGASVAFLGRRGDDSLAASALRCLVPGDGCAAGACSCCPGKGPAPSAAPGSFFLSHCGD